MEANVLELRLDWSEMDLFGHINNVSYFKYLQASRVHFWESLGIAKLYETEKIGPSLAKTSCSFLKPLHYPGKIRTEVWVKWVKNSSFQLHHFIYDANNVLCAEGEDVIVLFNYRKNKKHLLNPEQVEQLSGYIKG